MTAAVNKPIRCTGRAGLCLTLPVDHGTRNTQ